MTVQKRLAFFWPPYTFILSEVTTGWNVHKSKFSRIGRETFFDMAWLKFQRSIRATPRPLRPMKNFGRSDRATLRPKCSVAPTQEKSAVAPRLLGHY